MMVILLRVVDLESCSNDLIVVDVDNYSCLPIFNMRF
jgi:hypothetical protein